MLSKFAHPTAMRILAPPDERRESIQRDVFFSNDCLFFTGAFHAAFDNLIWALPRIWCKGQKETLWENTLPYLAAGSIVRLAHAALCPSVRSGT